MAQIFSRRFGLLLKAASLALFLLVLAFVFAVRDAASDPHWVGHPVTQPIPFSHQHHVNDVGLDCRYCHTGVETRAHARLPTVAICMTCHSQLYRDAPMLAPLHRAWTDPAIPLAWQRVHDLPDFVYFDHSIHINKGVGCSSCHGRVDQMPLIWRTGSLKMQWCLACHRAPEKVLRPRDQVFDMAWQAPGDQTARGHALLKAYGINKKKLTECSTCHR